LIWFAFDFLEMPKQKVKEPETYSSVLKSIQELGEKKKASALLPVMRTMTKYLYKADKELINSTIGYILTPLLFCVLVSLNCTIRENACGKRRQ
jgi:hypothetical protein